MNISIISVGKLKEKYLKMGIEEYVKRLSSYAKVDLIEVADEKAPEQLSEAEMEIVKKRRRADLSKNSGWNVVYRLPLMAK